MTGKNKASLEILSSPFLGSHFSRQFSAFNRNTASESVFTGIVCHFPCSLLAASYLTRLTLTLFIQCFSPWSLSLFFFIFLSSLWDVPDSSLLFLQNLTIVFSRGNIQSVLRNPKKHIHRAVWFVPQSAWKQKVSMPISVATSGLTNRKEKGFMFLVSASESNFPKVHLISFRKQKLSSCN